MLTDTNPLLHRNLVLSVIVSAFIITACEKEEDAPLSPTAKGYAIVKTTNLGPQQSVFTVCRIDLNYTIDNEVKIKGETFRPVLIDLSLLEGSVPVPGEIEKSTIEQSVTFYPTDLLAENTTYSLVASFGWDIQKNGVWERINDTPELIEKTFTTSIYSPPANVIKSITPAADAADQSLFINPFFLFENRLNEGINVEDQWVRPMLVSAGMMQDGNEVMATVSLSETNDTLMVTPELLLAPATSYEVFITCGWERKVNNVWKPVTVDGVEKTERVSAVFTTRDETSSLSALLPDNIKYSYPIPNQYHFLKHEQNIGFVVLNSGKQDNLFEEGYQYQAQYTSPGLPTFKVDLTLDLAKGKLTYAIPAMLENEKIYNLKFLKIPPGSPEGAETLYSFHFRTSMFNTFEEKMAGVTYTDKSLRQFVAVMVFELVHYFTPTESLDAFEVQVDSVHMPENMKVPVATNLIRFEAILEGNNWFENYIYPLMYAPWSDADFNPVITRDTTIVGRMPLNACGFGNFPNPALLTPEAIASNNAPPIPPNPYSYLIYELSPFFYTDFEEIQSQVVQRYLGNASNREREQKVLEIPTAPPLRQGFYETWIKYTLPDGTVTSKVKFAFENTISDNDG